MIEAVDKPDLAAINVGGIIASGLPRARRAMDQMNVVVAGAELADAGRGFYILANRERSAAERLLDYDCISLWLPRGGWRDQWPHLIPSPGERWYRRHRKERP